MIFRSLKNKINRLFFLFKTPFSLSSTYGGLVQLNKYLFRMFYFVAGEKVRLHYYYSDSLQVAQQTIVEQTVF